MTVIVQLERPSPDATAPGQRALFWFYSVRQVTRGKKQSYYMDLMMFDMMVMMV